MESLPAEVVERVLECLDLASLVRTSQVSSRLREIVARRHYQPFLLSQEWFAKRVREFAATCRKSDQNGEHETHRFGKVEKVF